MLAYGYQPLVVNHSKHFIWNCHLQNVGHFVSASVCYNIVSKWLDSNESAILNTIGDIYGLFYGRP